MSLGLIVGLGAAELAVVGNVLLLLLLNPVEVKLPGVSLVKVDPVEVGDAETYFDTDEKLGAAEDNIEVDDDKLKLDEGTIETDEELIEIDDVTAAPDDESETDDDDIVSVLVFVITMLVTLDDDPAPSVNVNVESLVTVVVVVAEKEEDSATDEGGLELIGSKDDEALSLMVDGGRFVAASDPDRQMF